MCIRGLIPWNFEAVPIGAICLNFGMHIHPQLYFVYASIKDSAHMGKLA